FETYGAQAKANHCNSVWTPSVDEDSHIIMSLHHYDGRAGAVYNNTQFGYAKQYFQDNGIACVIGETGCQRVNLYDANNPVTDEEYQNQSDFLVEWTNGVLDAAETNGLKIIFWEDGGSFGMLNHSELKWDFPAEVETIMSRVYSDDNDDSEEIEEYTVTIDGVQVATAASGEKYTLPVSTEENFVCYSNGISNYNSGESITVENNISLTSLSIGSIVMEKGASMRLSALSGLRFYTNIDTDKLDLIRAAAKADDNMTVELGTLIGPTDLFGDELLLDDLDTKCAVKVSYTSSTYFTESDFKGIVGSIINILDKNASRDFVGRGFVKVTLNGVEKVYYADYSGGSVSNNSRNIGYIATCIKADNSYYSTLSESQKLIVEKYFILHNDVYCEDKW
ncbi:MAG: cellulase family glycosylhydrolase, partial [Acutalibacteraceae bacterium]|nr:cellulase family glycosylhydrolase [Acutalibacteraceae bacterium]